jgi:hypothetical protein
MRAKKMKDKAGIYVDLYNMRKLLKRAQFAMSKADRIIYGTPVLVKNGEVLADFVLAYDFADERDKYIRKMCADFEVLKLDLRIIAEDNVLKCPDPENARMKPETLKIEIFELVARIDEGITKWRKSVKGKIAPA